MCGHKPTNSLSWSEARSRRFPSAFRGSRALLTPRSPTAAARPVRPETAAATLSRSHYFEMSAEPTQVSPQAREPPPKQGGSGSHGRNSVEKSSLPRGAPSVAARPSRKGSWLWNHSRARISAFPLTVSPSVSLTVTWGEKTDVHFHQMKLANVYKAWFPTST